jgi:paraquat-inducible protein A
MAEVDPSPAPPDNNIAPEGNLIACPECDLLYRKRPLPHRSIARCARCNAVLYRAETLGLDRALALALTALLLLVLSNAFPILVVEFSGRREAGTFVSAVEQLWQAGLWPLALLVFVTSMLAPFLQIAGLLSVLALVLTGRARPWTARLYRYTRLLSPWSMLEIYLLALLVALVKLRDIVELSPGIAFFAFALLILVLPATLSALERTDIWDRLGNPARPDRPLPGAPPAELGT